MSPVSYSDVFELDLERGYAEDIHPGDLVRTSQNLYPHFSVIAVDGEKAWLRNVQTGVDGLTPISRCRKINGQPAL